MVPADNDMSGGIDIGKDINKLIDDDKYIGHDFCGPIERLPEDVVCSPFLDETKLDNYYADKCKGKTECTINLVSFMNPISAHPS